MKKLILLIATVTISHTFVFSQYCPCDSVIFTTQVQIDNFQSTYPGCKEIMGDVIIYGSCITNLNGLSNLTFIGGSLNIGSWEFGGNPLLTSLSGLNNLKSIGGDLGIKHNGALTSLTGLESLNFIAGNLSIGWNDITSLAGLDAITSIDGDLEIRNNSNLASIEDLGNLTYVGGFIFIENNITLSSLTGLNNLTFVKDDLYIGYNYILTSLSGLNNVTSIGGDLYIYFNDALTSLEGLEGLTSLGSIFLQGNGALNSLSGLDNVTTITGSLWIGGINSHSNNSSLTSLYGLNNLTTIGGNLAIKYNSALTSLTGLDNVTTIGGALCIFSNNDLTNLTSLENIDPGSIECLKISFNNSLSNCDASSICTYLQSPDCTVEISNNAAGCNSTEELRAVCNPGGVDEVFIEDGYKVFPNPFNKTTTIEYQLKENSFVYLIIFNHLGQMMNMLVNEQQSKGTYQVQWNAEGLPAGVYYFQLKSGNQVTGRKIIKL